MPGEQGIKARTCDFRLLRTGRLARAQLLLREAPQAFASSFVGTTATEPVSLAASCSPAAVSSRSSAILLNILENFFFSFASCCANAAFNLLSSATMALFSGSKAWASSKSAFASSRFRSSKLACPRLKKALDVRSNCKALPQTSTHLA
eukprot:CAMPEP_0117505342 /NCGR_PEP_ID=MMETSP0784-20121206/25327_1 /TAXON_ID=39447 /ORGANISM="" /LENGTH=148 /DNA_ID=CAMNT_0005300749 /DNA_START=88 /DNA_END=534 /DNA_ORIENTATION=-